MPSDSPLGDGKLAETFDSPSGVSCSASSADIHVISVQYAQHGLTAHRQTHSFNLLVIAVMSAISKVYSVDTGYIEVLRRVKVLGHCCRPTEERARQNP